MEKIKIVNGNMDFLHFILPFTFPTPDKIFDKNNLSKDNIENLKQARKIFMEQLNNWERQRPFYEKKIESINNEDNSQKYTWSIFLKTREIIGQITVQPVTESYFLIDQLQRKRVCRLREHLSKVCLV